MVKISELIHEKTVFFLHDLNRRAVLDELVAKADELGLILDVPVFKAAIEAREAACSTAIGDGIAIPHAKISGMDHFFIMTAVLTPAVEWDAPDQKPVRIVFLIGGPDHEQKAYLGLLGKILRSVKNADRKEMILASRNASEIVNILTQ